MPEGAVGVDVEAARTGRRLSILFIVAILGAVAIFLGKLLIDSGRPGTLTIAVGGNTFSLTLPDAEESLDLATILDQALPRITSTSTANDRQVSETRRASTLVLLQGHQLYEFGGDALVDRIRRLNPTTDSEYTEEFLGLVRNRQGPFRNVRFEEIPPAQTIEVVFWDGINQHFAAVCDQSVFYNKYVRLVSTNNSDYLVLYASSVLVREDCSISPNARMQINIDQARQLFDMDNLPRSLPTTVSLNPAEPPFQNTTAQ